MHAIRNIAVGEEITITYIDPFIPRLDRLKKLKDTWGFECSCPLCAQPNAMGRASDATILNIKGLCSTLSHWTKFRNPEARKSAARHNRNLRQAPQMAELLISLTKQERGETLMFEAYRLATLVWNAVGEEQAAMQYAAQAIEFGLISAGLYQEDVLEVIRLYESPQKHWSWRSFLVKE